jgi:hypothetical protein
MIKLFFFIATEIVREILNYLISFFFIVSSHPHGTKHKDLIQLDNTQSQQTRHRRGKKARTRVRILRTKKNKTELCFSTIIITIDFVFRSKKWARRRKRKKRVRTNGTLNYKTNKVNRD